MTTSYKLMAAGLLLVILGGLVWFYGNSREEAGILKERTAQLSAQAVWRKQFDRDRQEGAERVRKAEAKLIEARKQTDALKADIAKRDKDAADWLAVRMPVAFADLVWMLDACGVSSVPCGFEPASKFDPTGKAYRTSHE